MTLAPERLIQHLPHPLLLIGPARRVVAANAAMRAVLDDDPEGLHFITALRQPGIVAAVEAVLSQGKPVTAEYTDHSGDRARRFDARVAAEAEVVLVQFQDRSAREDVDTLRRDFVANVSHELRTPLTTITGFIETLLGPAKDDAAARGRFLETMGRETARMTQLVEDLLSLSRVEDSARRRPETPVDLATLLRDTMADLRPVLAAREMRVTLDAPDTATIPADAGQVRQVIANLVENAAKYGPEGGEIRVRLTSPASHPRLRAEAVILSVHNDGPGIPEHHLPRLSERFYRVDTHRSREVGGTGLGLAIVKHIVTRHRGLLRIDSAPGQGVTVEVALPTALSRGGVI